MADVTQDQAATLFNAAGRRSEMVEDRWDRNGVHDIMLASGTVQVAAGEIYWETHGYLLHEAPWLRVETQTWPVGGVGEA